MATTVSLKPNAVEISGSTSGTTTLQATAVAGTTTLTLPAATDTLVGKATTDTLTNKTLTTPSVSSPTISDGTANGVAYLNGSKAVTSGSALVFDGTNLGIGPSTSGLGKIEIQQQSTTAGLWVQTGGTTSSYVIADFRNGANVPALTIFGDARSTFVNTVGVGQATPSTSGSGITFPATQSASTDANTLDDYEEGTWTPTPDGNFTYTDSVFTGNYTKIGRLVNVNMRIVTTTGNVAWISGASVTGLPFTAATNRAGSWSNIANFTEGGFCGAQSTSITMITARTASADNFDVSVTYFV